MLDRPGLRPVASIPGVWGLAPNYSTISAVSTTACISTSVPAVAHSFEISSASLCYSPSTQGHITMAVGATRLIQQASCPAPETRLRWE